MNQALTKTAMLVNSKHLHELLKKLTPALPSRSVIPIIENFLFDIEANRLHITATNLEISMKGTIQMEALQQPKKVAVPAKVITSILGALPEQPISIRLDESNVMHITANSGKYKINCEDGNVFPEVEYPDQPDFSSRLLTSAISKVLFAASTDQDKAALNGVFIEAKNGKVNAVATDAHRLQVNSIEESLGRDFEVIVPLRAAQIVSGLSDNINHLGISTTGTHIYFHTISVMMAARLIDQRYPDYRGVIPGSNPNTLTVDKASFLSALKRVKIFSNKSTYQVKLSISGSNLLLECEDPDFANKGREEITCEYQGRDLVIGFNAEFLYETCYRTEGETIKIELSEPNRPAIITNESDNNSLGIVMPIMLNTYD